MPRVVYFVVSVSALTSSEDRWTAVRPDYTSGVGKRAPDPGETQTSFSGTGCRHVSNAVSVSVTPFTCASERATVA